MCQVLLQTPEVTGSSPVARSTSIRARQLADSLSDRSVLNTA